MRTRRLGIEGPEVSVVGLGCNNFGGRLGLEETRAVVDAALDVGIALFDTADIYGNGGGSEDLLGQALEGRRDRVVLATKFGMDMGDGAVERGSRSYIRKAIEGSLRRLRTDYIDLYQYHRFDAITPFEETFGALDELVREGKVCFVGHSNLEPRQVEEVDELCRAHDFARPVSAQNEYSLLKRQAEEELLPTCERLGLGVLPYFPLASGLLTGKYKRDAPRPEGTRLSGRDEGVTGERHDAAPLVRDWIHPLRIPRHQHEHQRVGGDGRDRGAHHPVGRDQREVQSDVQSGCGARDDPVELCPANASDADRHHGVG